MKKKIESCDDCKKEKMGQYYGSSEGLTFVCDDCAPNNDDIVILPDWRN